jgi:hypothetical protein
MTDINCNICCEDVKSVITCDSCDTECCIKCCKKYLLTIFDAHCMGCKKQWDEKFIRDSFPKSWVNGEYKHHIKNKLFEQEKTYIPITMEAIEHLSANVNHRIDQYDSMIKESDKKSRIYSIEKELLKLHYRDRMKNEERIKTLKEELIVLRQKKNSREEVEIEFDEKEGNILKKCPVEECKGYLKNDICSVCDAKICVKCYNKEEGNHVCKQEDIDTYKLILKESKSCPKCAIRISKINGCKQIFCVQCQTVWDWNTGNIQEKGVIHNPEYFRWMRDRGLEVSRKEAIINHHRYLDNIDNISKDLIVKFGSQKHLNVDIKLDVNDEKETFNIINIINETSKLYRQIRSNLRTPFVYTDITFRNLRVDYILNNMSETKFINTIIKQYKEHQYDNMVRNLDETIIVMIENLFTKLKDMGEVEPLYKTFVDFINYYNHQVITITKLFGYTTCILINIKEQKFTKEYKYTI